ncbi:MAG TPA: PHB depolymerase family esterase [Kiritimatiellia bacterium]|nr:PHB depolymerase family esterase [Kiritimatiellia bacterium]
MHIPFSHSRRASGVFVVLLSAALTGTIAEEASAFLFRGRIRERIAERRADREAAETTEAVTATAGVPGDHRYTIQHGGRERWFTVHVPASYSPDKAVPLVMNLHGGAGNPNQQRDDSRLDAVADANGFIVVYPAGTGRMSRERLLTWNIGEGDTYATKENVDDIGFLRAVLDHVAANFAVDEKRIYVTGFSQGAFMCYRLACEMSDRIAAIAPVGGVMLGPESRCKPERPVSIIHFHGVKDPNVAYAGGIGERAHDRIARRSVEQTIAFWLKQNKLPEEPTTERRIGNARLKRYGPGPDGVEVAVWSLENGGHTWPGGDSSLPERMVGAVNRDIDASALAWEFLKKHARP